MYESIELHENLEDFTDNPVFDKQRINSLSNDISENALNYHLQSSHKGYKKFYGSMSILPFNETSGEKFNEWANENQLEFYMLTFNDEILMSINVLFFDNRSIFLNIIKEKYSYFLNKSSFYTNIHRIKIPNNANVKIKYNDPIHLHFLEYSSDIVIIESSKKIYDDPDLCKIAVNYNGLFLKLINNQTPELCNDAISNNINAIKYVKEEFITMKMCELACVNFNCSLSAQELNKCIPLRFRTKEFYMRLLLNSLPEKVLLLTPDEYKNEIFFKILIFRHFSAVSFLPEMYRCQEIYDCVIHKNRFCRFYISLIPFKYFSKDIIEFLKSQFLKSQSYINILESQSVINILEYCTHLNEEEFKQILFKFCRYLNESEINKLKINLKKNEILKCKVKNIVS
jgi:hypothetical protein